MIKNEKQFSHIKIQGEINLGEPAVIEFTDRSGNTQKARTSSIENWKTGYPLGSGIEIETAHSIYHADTYEFAEIKDRTNEMNKAEKLYEKFTEKLSPEEQKKYKDCLISGLEKEGIEPDLARGVVDRYIGGYMTGSSLFRKEDRVNDPSLNRPWRF